MQDVSEKAEMKYRMAVLVQICRPALFHICKQHENHPHYWAVIADKTEDMTLLLLSAGLWRQTSHGSEPVNPRVDSTHDWSRYSHEKILTNLSLAVNEALDRQIEDQTHEGGQPPALIRSQLLAVHEVLNALLTQEIRRSAFG